MSWVKMRKNLRDDPRVRAISRATSTDLRSTCGALFWFWAYADDHSRDGELPHTTPQDVDDLVATPGFAGALQAVHWLQVSDAGNVLVPRFDEHNGDTARERAQSAKRQSLYRNRNGVTGTVTGGVTGSVTHGKNCASPDTTHPTPPHTDTPEIPLSPSAPKPDGLQLSMPGAESDALEPDDLVQGYNDLCAAKWGLPRVTLPLGDERRKRIKTRLKEHPDIGFWETVFANIGKSELLRSGSDKWVGATLDWLTKNATNPTRVFEGQYSERRNGRR